MKKQKRSKITETQKLLFQAFFELLQEKPVENISVSEICKRAQVVRKTFYNNFKAKEEIIGLAAEYLLNSWDVLENVNKDSVCGTYRFIFEFVSDNRELFTLLSERGLFRIAEGVMVQYCIKRWPLPENYPIDMKYADYYLSATIASIISILNNWIRRGFCDSVDEMVQLTDTLILSSK